MPPSSSASSDTTHARYQTLLEIAEAISEHRQISTLFNNLSRLLRRLVQFDFIGLTLIDAEHQLVRLHVLESDYQVVGNTTEGTPFDQTPTMAAVETRRPYYMPEVDEEKRFPKVRELL